MTPLIRWMPKNAKPAEAGWFYVRNSDIKGVSCRYYDDTKDAWYFASSIGFAPNDSFSEWMTVPFKQNNKQ